MRSFIDMFRKALIGAALLLPMDPSFACKPRFYKVSDYLAGSTAHSVVFSGIVTKVDGLKESNGTTLYDIVFKPVRWVVGQPVSMVTVRGVGGSMLGTDCEGQFDFLANVGDECLIFGNLYEGKVIPDVFVSRRATNGKFPGELVEELKRNGIEIEP
ncbi:hypothetical protein ACN9MZ_06490 [Pseudoduganella sp. S-14]|uniref:hypothetical protein n=1 Tax=Pseudoduganella sp. S-14 TaxID=3404065 RepID=UPI003CF48E92